MEWSRVKNILIVLLAMVNCFLFFVYLNTTMGDAKVDEEFVEHTISVLGKNGIYVESELIPRNSPLLYPVTATYVDVEYFCGNLLNKVGVAEFEAKLNNGGTVELDFECNFKIEAPKNQTAAMQIMTKMASESGMEIAPPAVEESDGTYIVRAQQKLMGIPLCNGILTLTIAPDGNAKLTGAMVSGEVTTVESERPYDVCGLLVSAIGSLPKGEITSIGRAYYCSVNGDGVYCIPVWRITIANTDYFINAMTSEVLKLTY